MKERSWCFWQGDEGNGGGEAAPAPASVTVEEMNIEAAPPAEAAPAEPPRDELEIGYRYGQLEARMAALEAENARLTGQLAAFEAATVAVLDAEQSQIEQQAEVLSDVAEEVLPPEHDGANALNPEHQAKKPHWWEGFMGGHHR